MNNTKHPHRPRQLASDTYAGICPEAIAAIGAVNQGHAFSYGDDPWTMRAQELFREFFETDCEVFFVATGTACNALALASLCKSYHSVLCHADSHIHTDECGAPEYAAGGIKLLPIQGAAGKLDPDKVRRAAAPWRDVHSHKPGVLSLTEATEAGTVYSHQEILALTTTARELGLRLHMDGARFANALATLALAPKGLTWQAGIDVLSFGGTKNGLASGDAIVFFDRALAEEFGYRCKQAGHLQAKMRYVAAPWIALFESGGWLRNAAHANEMARLLEQKLRSFPELRILYPVQANAVIVDMPRAVAEGLHRRGWHFYSIAGGERLMCSWDTAEEDINALIQDLRAALSEE
jgi:threonine aldolase